MSKKSLGWRTLGCNELRYKKAWKPLTMTVLIL